MRKLGLTIVAILVIGTGVYFTSHAKRQAVLPDVISDNTQLAAVGSTTAVAEEEVLPDNDFIPAGIVQEIPAETSSPDSSPKPETTSTEKTDAELQAKIDQLFMIGFRGYTYESATDMQRALSDTNLGGVILFDYDTPTKKYARNIQSEAQLKKLITDLQANAKTKLFVAVDEEGGKVSRLKSLANFEKTASAAFLGTQPTATVQATGKNLGTQLASYGFNINFAPDLDVNVNPKNPVIGAVERSFSADPAIVSEKGIAFIKGLLAGGITPVGKHFPGHGSSTSDSHLGFVDITDTYKDYELDPFKAACAADLPAVMIAHVYNKNVDAKYPATLSKAHIQNLKQDAGCSTQLIFSDDMDMRAISSGYGRETALTLAINAGIDVIVISNNVTGYNKEAYFEARKLVFDAVKKGTISKARIEQAYSKIVDFKY